MTKNTRGNWTYVPLSCKPYLGKTTKCSAESHRKSTRSSAFPSQLIFNNFLVLPLVYLGLVLRFGTEEAFFASLEAFTFRSS